jgi:hypothetical protein
LGNRTFEGDVIDLVIIISTLALGFIIGIVASSDCEDCAMSWESFNFLLGFFDLWGRWWLWVGFCFHLEVGVILCWICYLWSWQWVCYLWS